MRRLARDSGLPVADSRESQDLCFVAGIGGTGVLRRPRAAPRRPGPIVDRDGRVLGATGPARFTVGQRRGLKIASTEPLYVLSKDARTATVTEGPREALAATGAPREHDPAPPGAHRPDRPAALPRQGAALQGARDGAGTLELELETGSRGRPRSARLPHARYDYVVGEDDLGTRMIDCAERIDLEAPFAATSRPSCG